MTAQEVNKSNLRVWIELQMKTYKLLMWKNLEIVFVVNGKNNVDCENYFHYIRYINKTGKNQDFI